MLRAYTALFHCDQKLIWSLVITVQTVEDQGLQDYIKEP